MLLAETGLLDGHDATTHWAYCDALATRHPNVRVHPQRVVVTAGPDQRLVMGGGGSSWHDLSLYLIARVAGIECAMQTARVFLIDWHQTGQQPFASLARTRTTSDAAVSQAQVWIAQHYDTPSPVAGMLQASGLAERIAQGDLSLHESVSRSDEFGDLLRALYTMSSALGRMVQQVRQSTDSIAIASAEIATGNHDLSARTEQTSSNLQETAAAMEEFTSTIQQSAGSAQQASSQTAMARSRARCESICECMARDLPHSVHAVDSRHGDAGRQRRTAFS